MDQEQHYLLECKTANQFLMKEWEGEEVPASYLLQVQHYLAVTGAEIGYIAVLIGGQKFIWKEVQRDEELIEMIIQSEEDFWELVERKTPPALDGSSAAERYLSEKYSNAEVGKIEQLGFEYKEKIKNYFELKEQKGLLDNQITEIENQIKGELKNAEFGFAPGYSITWKNTSRNVVDSKKLKSEYPEIYEKVVKESKSRRFSIKEEK